MYAFNLEIARTRETVSEAMIGAIRLQWWRDGIEKAYRGEVLKHPVLEPLTPLIAAYDLARADFETLIDAREFDFEEQPPETVDRLLAYAAESSAPLISLAMQICGYAGDMAVARHAGLAWGLTGLLRAMPYHLRQRRNWLPRDLIGQYNVDLRETNELRATPEIAALVEDLAGRAADCAAKARSGRGAIPGRAVSPLLVLNLLDTYHRQFRKAGNNPFDPRFSAAPPWRVFPLTVKGLMRRY